MAREVLTLTCELLQTCQLRDEDGVIDSRAAIKMQSVDIGFTAINQTKIVTAASELARNVLEHGLGGHVEIYKVTSLDGPGIKLCFIDSGPGIENLELALTDGYTSKNGLGLGLTGSRRLMDDFDIRTEPGRGTTVVVTKWK